MTDQSDLVEQLRRLEAEAEALRIERERAEMHARQARRTAEAETLAAEQRERERIEREEFAALQRENAAQIKRYQANPWLYCDEKGLWND